MADNYTKIKIYTADEVEQVLTDAASNANVSSAVTAPTITAPTGAKYDTTITLTASGSITAYKDNGATIDHYEWLLPDNSTVNGNSIQYTMPDNTHLGETITIKCKATDSLGNTSSYSSTDITTSSNNPPIIDNVQFDGNVDANGKWSENDDYTCTITAHDPDGDTLTYGLTCNNTNVTIVQNTTNLNIFSIHTPDVTEDTNITFTVTVSDTNNSSITDTEQKIIRDGLPIGDIGVFGGGANTNNAYINTVDYITISVLGNAIDFGDLTVSKGYLATTSNSINDRGVFGGGFIGNTNYLNTIDYITISILGNAIDFGDLTISRYGLAATSNGTNNRGVFGGGYTATKTIINTIDYITISILGNAIDFGDLTVSRRYLVATSNGTNDRGVFGGGLDSNYSNTIDYITISILGNAMDFGDLTVSRDDLVATSNGTNDRGVFGGGASTTNTIDYITISILGNAIDFGDLIIGRSDLTATSNGANNRGVFGGGYGNNITNTIDYITISILGNAIDFGDLTVSRYGLTATSNA